jgi:multiple sugar transport system substrate-binding protein
MRGGLRRKIDALALDFAGLPSCGSPISVLHSDAYSMTAASDAKDAAWRSMEFALGPERQRITSEAGRTIPSLRSVVGSDTFLDPGGGRALEVAVGLATQPRDQCARDET